MCDVHAASNKSLCLLATSSWLQLADLSSILSRTAVDLARNIASSALDVHRFCRHRRRPLCMYATSAIPSEEPNACAWPYPHGSDWVAHSPTAAVVRCGSLPSTTASSAPQPRRCRNSRLHCFFPGSTLPFSLSSNGLVLRYSSLWCNCQSPFW